MRLINGDCLEELPRLAEEGIKVDMVLTDLPYGTTACKWDNIIPFKEMWACLDKVTNEDTPIVLFGTEPFSSNLRLSNIDYFKYDWIWVKDKGTNIFNVNKRPMNNYELISIFYKKQPFYNPIMRQGKPYKKIQRNSRLGEHLGKSNKKASDKFNDTGERFPQAVLYFSRDTSRGISYHPTQKPVKLLAYLIKTYTKEGGAVLDFTMGSGSTGGACLKTNRKFIGIEKDPNYFHIAQKRLFNTKWR